jgi:hypothetical protein
LVRLPAAFLSPRVRPRVCLFDFEWRVGEHYSTPENLLKTVNAVLQAYKLQKNKTNLTGQAAELMNPAVIGRMTEIGLEIESQFM